MTVFLSRAVRRFTVADGSSAVTDQQVAGVTQCVFTHAAPAVLSAGETDSRVPATAGAKIHRFALRNSFVAISLPTRGEERRRCRYAG